MLHGITWLQFISYLGGALVLYYLVLFVMHAKEGVLKGRQPPGQPPTNMAGKKRIWHVEEREIPPVHSPDAEPESDPPEENDDIPDEESTAQNSDLIETDQEEQLFDNLESLAAVVQQVITDAGLHTDKATLFHRLQKQITHYPDLQHPAFRIAITKLIVRQAKLECDLDISSDEVTALWLS